MYLHNDTWGKWSKEIQMTVNFRGGEINCPCCPSCAFVFFFIQYTSNIYIDNHNEQKNKQ